MEYIDELDDGNLRFKPYRYDLSISYRVEGWEDYLHTLISAYSEDILEGQFPYVGISFVNGTMGGGLNIDPSKTEAVTSFYSNSDSSLFYVDYLDGFEL